MSDQPETSQRVSVPEAAELLGVSVATVRRRIRSGQLRADVVHRPQGIAYVVVLGSDHDEQSASDQQVGITAPLNQSPSDAMATWSASVLAPVVAALERSQAIVREQAEAIGELRATVASLEAQNATLTALTSTQTPEPSTEPSRLWWRSRGFYGATVLVAIVTVIWLAAGR